MSNGEMCYCKDRHAIVIDRRSASRITSCIALVAFFVFATGYFIGKKQAVQDNLGIQELPSFDSRIQHAMNKQSQPQASLMAADMQHFESQKKFDNVYYVALLAGYGTQRAAQQFAQHLEKKGIKSEVKTRLSTNSQKKSRKWYQVVTKKYSNKQELLALVEQLKNQDHLGNDVRIIEIT